MGLPVSLMRSYSLVTPRGFARFAFSDSTP
jgi:hypothetical protein